MLFVYSQPPEELAFELLAVQCAFVVAKIKTKTNKGRNNYRMQDASN